MFVEEVSIHFPEEFTLFVLVHSKKRDGITTLYMVLIIGKRFYNTSTIFECTVYLAARE